MPISHYTVGNHVGWDFDSFARASIPSKDCVGLVPRSEVVSNDAWLFVGAYFVTRCCGLTSLILLASLGFYLLLSSSSRLPAPMHGFTG